MEVVSDDLSRLDGVISVSAGWLTDQAALRTKAGRELTLEEVSAAVKPPFRVMSLIREE